MQLVCFREVYIFTKRRIKSDNVPSTLSLLTVRRGSFRSILKFDIIVTSMECCFIGVCF